MMSPGQWVSSRGHGALGKLSTQAGILPGTLRRILRGDDRRVSTLTLIICACDALWPPDGEWRPRWVDWARGRHP